jgi:hypothetical protein
MRPLFIVLLLGSFLGSEAQNRTGNAPVRRIMSRIPDSMTFSTRGISGYINSRFSNQREKARAIFIWIARNIDYNFDSIFASYNYQNPSEVSEKFLRSRVGVCLQFADLFTEIAHQCGIRSYVIQGYTKQNGIVDYFPHAWCAGFIDSTWYLFDPTWGSGYVSNGRFIKLVNNYYFMAKPEDLIRSHMPFDPLWQFLTYPVTNQEFYERNYLTNTKKAYFSFTDTLSAYEHESEEEQYISSARRIEQNGVKNAFTEAKLRVLKGKIEFYRNKTMAEKYSQAVIGYNEGIRKLNQFIKLSNAQFSSDNDTVHLKQLLDSTGILLAKADSTLTEIREPEAGFADSIDRLRTSIHGTMKVLNNQRTSLIRYIKTRRLIRT